MTDRKKIFLLLLVAILGFITFAIRYHRREPSYNGRSLSDWVALAATGDQEAYAAIHAMGSSALRCAVIWVAFEPNPAKEKVDTFIMTKGASLLPFVPMSLRRWLSGDEGKRRARRASLIVLATGDRAAEIAPVLKDLSRRGRSSEVRYRALETLSCMGTNALPQFIQILHDRQHPHRRAAVGFIAEIAGKHPCATALVEGPLIECLADEDPIVAVKASEAIGDIGTPHGSAIPRLLKNLSSTNRLIIVSAQQALAKLAPNCVTNRSE